MSSAARPSAAESYHSAMEDSYSRPEWEQWRDEEGFEDQGQSIQRLQEELLQHSSMAAAAAAWPSDVDGLEKRCLVIWVAIVVRVCTVWLYWSQ